MADIADQAQLDAEVEEMLLAAHIAAKRSSLRWSHCIECGEALDTVRQSIHACRCVACQNLKEIKERK